MRRSDRNRTTRFLRSCCSTYRTISGILHVLLVREPVIDIRYSIFIGSMAASTLKATWRKVAQHDLLKRSSHAVAAIDGEVFVFGGELVAREPRDGHVHSVGVIEGELSTHRHSISSPPVPYAYTDATYQTRKPHQKHCLPHLMRAQRHELEPQWSP